MTPNRPNWATFDLATFVNDPGLLSIGKNLFRETEARERPRWHPGTDGYGTLLQGYLEQSNVNLTAEMASMITTQRAFEINSKQCPHPMK